MNKKLVFQLVVPPVFLTICLVVFILLFSMPTISKGIATRAEISRESKQLQETVNKDEALRKAKKDEKQITATYDTVNALWPDKEEVSNFIVLMEELAGQKHITINNIAVEESSGQQVAKPKAATTDDTQDDAAAAPKKTAKKQSGIKFSFDTTGNYATIVDLISSLESLKRFNSVSTMVLDGNTLGDIITLRITGYIYAN